MTLGIAKRHWRFVAVLLTWGGNIAATGVLAGWSWEPAALFWGWALFCRSNADYTLGEEPHQSWKQW
jgi:hypothetical protein